MLKIEIPPIEEWDDLRQEFSYFKGATLELEHSLISLSKWESKWCKSFLRKGEKSFEEILDYIRCMTITTDVAPETYERLTEDNLKAIDKYINAPMTATYFNETKNKGMSREPVTSELIYYWMIALNIPFECQNWHLNRLLTLIKVCNLKNQPPKKRNVKDIMRRNSDMNRARRTRLGTKG